MNDPTEKENLMMHKKEGEIFRALSLGMQDGLNCGAQVGRLALGYKWKENLSIVTEIRKYWNNIK